MVRHDRPVRIDLPERDRLELDRRQRERGQRRLEADRRRPEVGQRLRLRRLDRRDHPCAQRQRPLLRHRHHPSSNCRRI